MKALFGALGGALVLASYALPLAVSAASSAGFAPGSLWLSSTQPTAGDALKVYTVLYDSTSAPISGDVEFDIDSTVLQTIHFSLDAGQTQIVSADWTAASGSHSFSATLANLTGIGGSASNSTTDTVNVTVAPAPPSPIAQYSSIVNNLYASSSPQVQNIVQAIASTTEGWRLSGEKAITDALGSASSSIPSGQVLGAATYRAPANAAGSGSDMFNSLWRTFLAVLLFVFQIQWLFYLALAIVAYIVFKIIQGVFRYRR